MSKVLRDSKGMINGPCVSLPGHSNRTFVGEAHELMHEIDLLIAEHGGSDKLEEDIRQIVDVALGVGFDYGDAHGRKEAGDGNK